MLRLPHNELKRFETLSAIRVLLITYIAIGFIALKTGEAAKQPNILFAIADDWSFGHAGAYGCEWVETPSFDRVARQGILFTRAYTPNAKCCPSRSIIVTGRNSWQLEDACNHICAFPPKFKSYVEALSENGYTVGSTGKGWGPGYAKDASGKPRQLAGRPFNELKTKPPARGISNNDYSGNFAEFLKQAPQDKPWCFWYGTTEPHRGYEYGIGVKRGKKLSQINHVPKFWPDNETIRNDMLDYAVEVEHFDHHLGRILALLEERKALENTLVVVTSDHGMPFPRCKGQAYDYSNHVPLAILWPQELDNPGRTVDDYVSFADFAPTFIQAAGLNWKAVGMQPAAGRSLLEIVRSEKAGRVILQRDHILIGKERHDIGRPNDTGYPIRGIIKNDMLYIHNFETSRWPACNPETGYLNCDGSPTKTRILDGRTTPATAKFWELCFGKRPQEELYDVAADPDCVNNLADDPSRAKLKESLQKQLFTELKQQHDPRMAGDGDYFDKVPYVNAGTRNFYQRYMAGEKVRAGWVNASDFEEKPLD